MILKSFLIVFFSLFFSACVSISSLNPFSSKSSKDEKSDFVIPKDAPQWIKQTKETNYINAISYVQTKQKVSDFDKKRVLLQASKTLSNKLYIKIINFYKEYEKTLQNPTTFDKDIENIAKQISLEAVSKAQIRNSWLSVDKKLFVKISVDSKLVAKQIQIKSKKIYKINQNLYKNILSNRANSLLIEYLEK